jgi:hypothetical protein
MIGSEGATASVPLARQAPAGLADHPIDGPPTTDGQCTRRGPTAGAGNNLRPVACRHSATVNPPLPASARRVDPAG